VIPHSRGGVSAPDNSRVIYREHNRAKSARSVLGRVVEELVAIIYLTRPRVGLD
jgi:hypothetical protein